MEFNSSDWAHHLHKCLFKLVPLVILAMTFTSTLFPGNCRDVSVPYDFSSIQAAINASSPGDQIIITKIVNEENIIITKPLRLIGVDNGNGRPVISSNDTGGNIITFESDGIYLEGVEVLNKYGKSYASIYISSSNNIIQNVSLIGPYIRTYGIVINKSQNNTICNNSIIKNRYGISLENCELNRIYDNNITENWNGIVVFDKTINNSIYNNRFQSNEVGILYADALCLSKNIIINNTFINNYRDRVEENMLSIN